MVKLFYIYR